jgi:6-phosphogluconolactonase
MAPVGLPTYMMKTRNILQSNAIFLLAVLGCASGQSADYFVYAGTFTTSTSKGIYAYRFDSTTGHLSSLGLVAESTNPAFLIESANHRFLYAANERGTNSNTVSAYSINRNNGMLTFLNSVSAKGAAPCHIAIDRTQKWIAVANYDGGNVAVLPVRPDGRLGEATSVDQHKGSGPNPRQKGPHAHSVLFSPDNRFLFNADLGLDQVFVYRFNADAGSITPNNPPFAKVTPGTGPRHLAFHPNGKVLYAISEIGNHVTAFHFDPSAGTLVEFQSIATLPKDFTGNSTTAEIAVSQTGNVLYGSNRGHDSIVVFSIDKSNFTLSPIEWCPTQGRTPRNFTLDPSGAFMIVANQDTNNVVVYRVDSQTGRLKPTGQVLNDAPMPVSILFVPSANKP